MAGYLQLHLGHSKALAIVYLTISVFCFICGRVVKRTPDEKSAETPDPDPISSWQNPDLIKESVEDSGDSVVVEKPEVLEPNLPESPPEEERVPVQREVIEPEMIPIVHSYSIGNINKNYRAMYADIMAMGLSNGTRLCDLTQKIQGYGRRVTMVTKDLDKREQNPTHAAVAFDFVEIGLRIPEAGYLKVKF